MARHGGGRELTRSTELKQLIRSGIPRNYRTQVWKWLTKCIVGKKYVSTVCSIPSCLCAWMCVYLPLGEIDACLY